MPTYVDPVLALYIIHACGTDPRRLGRTVYILVVVFGYILYIYMSSLGDVQIAQRKNDQLNEGGWT